MNHGTRTNLTKVRKKGCRVKSEGCLTLCCIDASQRRNACWHTCKAAFNVTAELQKVEQGIFNTDNKNTFNYSVSANYRKLNKVYLWPSFR